MVNLFELINGTKTGKGAIRSLQKRKNYPGEKLFQNGHQMTLYISKSDSTLCIWSFKIRKCRQHVGIKTINWLQCSRLAFDKLFFIYFWCKNKTSIDFCKKELDMSANSVVDSSSYLREVCADEILRNSGKDCHEGKFVEVDDSLFTQRKYQGGRLPLSTWLVGGICWETQKVFLTVASDRSALTQMTAIENYIEPGTLIIMDSWKSYSILDVNKDFPHLTVNHRYNFVDPETGAHTQSIECLWREAKSKNKQQYETERRMLESYFCEFLWRKNQGQQNLFGKILETIAEFGLSMD